MRRLTFCGSYQVFLEIIPWARFMRPLVPAEMTPERPHGRICNSSGWSFVW